MEEQKKESEAPKELDKVERAELAVKRLEETEKRIDEKIAKLTELQADRILGSTAGGRIEPEAPKPMTSKEYATKVMSGELKAK